MATSFEKNKTTGWYEYRGGGIVTDEPVRIDFDRVQREQEEEERNKIEAEQRRLAEEKALADKEANKITSRVSRFAIGATKAIGGAIAQPFVMGKTIGGAFVEEKYKKQFYDEANKSFQKAMSFEKGSKERDIYLKEFQNLSQIANDYSENKMKSSKELGELTPARIAGISLDMGLSVASYASMAGPVTGLKGSLFMTPKQASQSAIKFMNTSKTNKIIADVLGFGERTSIRGMALGSALQAPLAGTVTAIADKEFQEADGITDKLAYVGANIAGSALVSFGLGMGLKTAGGIIEKSKKKGDPIDIKVARKGDGDMINEKEMEDLFKQDGKEAIPIRSASDDIDFNEVIKRTDSLEVAEKIQNVVDDIDMLRGKLVDGKSFDIDFENPEVKTIIQNKLEPLLNTLKTKYEAPPLPETISTKESIVSFPKTKTSGNNTDTPLVDTLLSNKKIKVNFSNPIDKALELSKGSSKNEAIKYLKDVKGWDEDTIKNKREELLARAKEKIQAELDNC